MRKLIIIMFCFFFFAVSSFALELQSPRFRIEVGDVEIDKQAEKEVVYTIETLFGQGSLSKFNAQGFLVKKPQPNEGLEFTLSPTLLTIHPPFSAASQNQAIAISVTTQNQSGFFLNFIQEYKLKNLSGQTLDLNYGLTKDGPFYTLPNQNSGDSPTVLNDDNPNQPGSIYFRLIPPTHLQEGTFETILNFIIVPDY